MQTLFCCQLRAFISVLLIFFFFVSVLECVIYVLLVKCPAKCVVMYTQGLK